MFSWGKLLNVREPVTKLYPFHKNNGTMEILAISNQQLMKDSNGTLTSIGAVSSDRAKFLTYKDRSINDVVLIADGGKLKVYNGVVNDVVAHTPTDGSNGSPAEITDPGLNDLGNLTNFRTIAMKKDRIFAAAHPTIKNRVSFSYFDPYLGYAVYDYWPAIYFFDVATEDNDEIVELKVFRDVLVILCKRSIWVLKGDGATLSDLQLIKINVPKGCISPDSVCEVGNNLFYLGDDHVYSLYATEQEFVSAQIMSKSVQPILKGIGLADKKKATSIFFDNKYYLSFPSGLTLVYDITLESWTTYTNVQANSFMNLDGVLYFGSDDGYMYRFNENLFMDDYKPIDFSLKTKLVDFDMPIHQKKFKKLWVMMKQWDNYESSYELKALVDQYAPVNVSGSGASNGEAIWDESVWDDAVWDMAEMVQNTHKFQHKGKNVQMMLTNSKTGEPLTVYGFAFEYKPKKAK